MLLGELEISGVELSDHAFENIDGSDKSRCKLPESIIKNIIKQRKGKQFYDNEGDSLHFVYQKNVVVTDYSPEEDLWEVITVYRNSNPVKAKQHRYSEVDPEDFKESRRQNQ